MLIFNEFYLGYDIEIAFKKVKTKIYFSSSTNQLQLLIANAGKRQLFRFSTL